MTTNEAVPLLTKELAEDVLGGSKAAHILLLDRLEYISSGAAVVIPATERVDIARVRAVIADLMDAPYRAGTGHPFNAWADELAAAIGDKT